MKRKISEPEYERHKGRALIVNKEEAGVGKGTEHEILSNSKFSEEH